MFFISFCAAPFPTQCTLREWKSDAKKYAKRQLLISASYKPQYQVATVCVINVLQLVLSWTTSIPDTILVAIAIQSCVGLQQLQCEQDAVHGHQASRPTANDDGRRATDGRASNVSKCQPAFPSRGKASEDAHSARQDQLLASVTARQERFVWPDKLTDGSAARWNAGRAFAAKEAKLRRDDEALYHSERCLPTDTSSVLPSEDFHERSTLDGPFFVADAAANRARSGAQVSVEESPQQSAAERSEEYTSAYTLARSRQQAVYGPSREPGGIARVLPLSWWCPGGAGEGLGDANASSGGGRD